MFVFAFVTSVGKDSINLDWGLLNKTKNISRQDESNIKVA
jgi:hypothetical protein